MSFVKRQIDIGRARSRIKRQLDAVAKAAAPAVTEAMADSAMDVVRLMRHLVPKESHKLEHSINWSYGEPPKTSASGAFRPKGSKKTGGKVKISIYAGNDEAFYPRFVEFGTAPAKKGQRVVDTSGRKRKAKRSHSGTSAQPFFFPAWRAKKKSVKAATRKAIKTAVRKGVKAS